MVFIQGVEEEMLMLRKIGGCDFSDDFIFCFELCGRILVGGVFIYC